MAQKSQKISKIVLKGHIIASRTRLAHPRLGHILGEKPKT